MTTIAYRNGVMAADSRAYSGGRMPIGQKAKIRRLADGTLIGVSTTLTGRAERIMAWFEAGADPSAAPAGDSKHYLLVVRPNGEVFYANDTYELSGPLSGEFFAVGSGEEYALGAMAMGAGPERAVGIACGLDVWSEPPIIALTLGGTDGPNG